MTGRYHTITPTVSLRQDPSRKQASRGPCALRDAGPAMLQLFRTHREQGISAPEGCEAEKSTPARPPIRRSRVPAAAPA